MLRTCWHCEKEKDEKEFYDKTRKDKVIKTKVCRICVSIQKKKHYHENIITVKNRAIQKRKLQRSLIVEYFSEHPCIDCNETDPIVLVFDHIDRSTKIGEVSDLLASSSWEKIYNEILKCEVRCVNCHMRKTAREMGYYAYL